MIGAIRKTAKELVAYFQKIMTYLFYVLKKNHSLFFKKLHAKKS